MYIRLHLLTLVPRSRIFFTLKMETIHSCETSVYTIPTRCHIPEDDIPQVKERLMGAFVREYVCVRDGWR
jgi:hypothetical protein